MINSALALTHNLVYQLALTTLGLIAFYNYGKKLIFKFSPVLAIKTTVIKHYSLSQITGVIELSIVAVCHVIFCTLLILVSQIDIISIFKNTSLSNCLYGLLIG